MITFAPGGPLLPCPFCGWVGDGLMESELWRHLAGSHHGAERIQKAEAELRSICKLQPERTQIVRLRTIRERPTKPFQHRAIPPAMPNAPDRTSNRTSEG